MKSLLKSLSLFGFLMVALPALATPQWTSVRLSTEQAASLRGKKPPSPPPSTGIPTSSSLALGFSPKNSATSEEIIDGLYKKLRITATNTSSALIRVLPGGKCPLHITVIFEDQAVYLIRATSTKMMNGRGLRPNKTYSKIKPPVSLFEVLLDLFGVIDIPIVPEVPLTQDVIVGLRLGTALDEPNTDPFLFDVGFTIQVPAP